MFEMLARTFPLILLLLHLYSTVFHRICPPEPLMQIISGVGLALNGVLTILNEILNAMGLNKLLAKFGGKVDDTAGGAASGVGGALGGVTGGLGLGGDQE